MRSTIEIILKSDVQRIFDEFSSCFNIRIGFMSTAGKEIAVSSHKNLNTYCSLINCQLNKQSLCYNFEKQKRRQALRRKDMITAKCFAGMIETIIPIYFEGIHLGFLRMGQYRDDSHLDKRLIKEWIQKFGSPEKIVLAYLQTPSFSEEKIESIKKLFRVMVEYIVSQNMITVKSNLIIEKILNYAKEHPDQNISIHDAADIALKSPSTISHLFSSVLKKSFKQVMIELKLEKAEEYFRDNPEITVKEVCFRLGFQDPYYFSRLYKKYRGFAPTLYKSKSVI